MKKVNKKIIKAQADKIIKYCDWNGKNLAKKICDAHIQHNGFYTYTESETGKKVFVEA